MTILLIKSAKIEYQNFRAIPSSSSQLASKSFFPSPPLPSAAYVARSYQLLNEDQVKQEWPGHSER